MADATRITKRWVDQYLEWQREFEDPIVDEYPLMEDPFSVISIIAAYLTVVYWGPRLMANRKPYSLKTYTNSYNLAQIVFCSYYVISIYVLTENEPDGVYLMCKRWDRSVTDYTRKIAYFQYVNFAARVIELSETVVHILRKKNRLITYLHVTHHTMNVALGWLTTRFRPGGSASTICMLNYAVHLIMFTYYWASTQEGTVWQKQAAKMKKYLTLIQMVQFGYMTAIIIQDMIADACGSQFHFVANTTIAVLVINMILFTNFYVNNYGEKRKLK